MQENRFTLVGDVGRGWNRLHRNGERVPRCGGSVGGERVPVVCGRERERECVGVCASMTEFAAIKAE